MLEADTSWPHLAKRKAFAQYVKLCSFLAFGKDRAFRRVKVRFCRSTLGFLHVISPRQGGQL